jgi:hypothetical protein
MYIVVFGWILLLLIVGVLFVMRLLLLETYDFLRILPIAACCWWVQRNTCKMYKVRRLSTWIA